MSGRTPSSPASSGPGNSVTTRTVRAGVARERQHGAVMPPIHLTSNFTFDGVGGKREYDYTRSGNPTRDLLAEALAELEGAAGATVTGSGMSAIHLALQLLEPGDRVVAAHDCYGGTYRLLEALARRDRIDVAFTDLSDPRCVDAAFVDPPRMVWIESPSNPLMRITDIRDIVARARRSGTRVVVDNTFLSPVFQRPLELGADLVVHSTTKYLNGHGDVVGGALLAKEPELAREIAWWANCLGLAGSPFDSYQTLRGLRTLHARMRIHEQNAWALLELLREHPAVERVHHPGIPGHPGHEVAREQQSGHGGMLSFEVAGGRPAVDALVDGLRCFTLAESLGGVESLISHPATMTHAAMEPAARRRAGISDNLMRLSAGIEQAGDLIDDLRAGLDRARRQAALGAAATRLEACAPDRASPLAGPATRPTGRRPATG